MIRAQSIFNRFNLLLVLALAMVSVGAAANKKVGTSGAQFLKIGAGARPTAMGEAFVGIADDVIAVYYNPAGLGFISRPQMTAMHTQWFQGMDYDFGAFAYPTNHGAFALSAATLKADDIARRGADESEQGDFGSLDAAYALSYARNMGPQLSLGLTARYLKQEIDSASAGAWGGDAGILKRLERYPVSVGLAVLHFGQEVKFNEEGDPQPLTIDLGFGVDLFRDRLKLGLNTKKPRDNDMQYGVGSEWKQPLGEDFRAALRAGYNSAGTDPDGTTGISLGAGLGFRQIDFDFAWVPFGDLGNTFRYAIVAKF